MATVFHDVVRVEREGTILIATIEHPPANAVSRDVITGLGEAIKMAEADPACRTVILTGAGERFFAAGADIKEFTSHSGEAIAAGQELTLSMERCRLPIIAAVNGIALGGGCELALACDLRIAATGAKFGQPEINLGIIPGWGGTQRLPRLLGQARAMELLLTGDPIDAARALEIGLVSQVVAPDELGGAVRALARRVESRAPLAVAATKRAVRDGADLALEAALEVEHDEFVRLFGTDDAREGIEAFVSKRDPVWRGR